MLQCLRVLATLVGVFFLVWGALALYYRLHVPPLAAYALVGLWSLASLGALVLLWRTAWAGYAVLALLLSALLIWWGNLTPSNTRDWADDVAHTLTGRISEQQVHLVGVRNFAWQSERDYQIRWQDQDYALDQVQTVDVITSHWGMPAIAHVIVSFGLSDGRYLAFSVETRKERHEAYSELGGFFKEYELSVIAADERDVLGVRANVRGEDLYLYRLNVSPKTAQKLFVSYVEKANELAQKPVFYHTLTANCTTVVFAMVKPLAGHLPFDYRLLLTGFLAGYLYDLEALQMDQPLETLRAQGRITDKAIQAINAPDFSRQIRQGIPGIDAP